MDRKIRSAKEKKIANFIDDNGFIYCEDCKLSGHVSIIDCSHDISVEKCKQIRQVEIAWDIDNIKLRCRKCHEKHDKLNIQSAKVE